MSKPRLRVPTPEPLAFLSGGGEMGQRMRELDWSQTLVGSVADWPQSLMTVMRLMLDSRYPMFVAWGPELNFFYNDAYIPVLGQRHPAALGRPAAEIWAEIWDTIGQQIQSVMIEGRATWSEESLLVMERNHFSEETYFTYSYSPIPEDGGGIRGVFCACTEDIDRVLSERRLRTLRELAARTMDEAKCVEEACQTSAECLARNPHDLPFTLLYLLDGERRRGTLASLSGLAMNTPASPLTVDLDDHSAPWPFYEVVKTGKAVEVTNLAERLGALPGGAWPEPCKKAIVLPMAKPGQAELAGFVVAGVSPRRPLDDAYRGFFDLLAGQIAAAVASARAYEEERRRAEALAELDKAKTAFFSKVSHEFRTPLTLMLGPLEDVLAKSDEQTLSENRELLTVVHRNGLRLQRLVNSLLDFSRIEAGRLKACFESTDLAQFTAELASNFRSACEKAGLQLQVDCTPHREPVFVDRQMYEKIVLNLLSNAFKFTFAGEIVVRLRPAKEAIELQINDTGIGIPVEEMPRLFERFHCIDTSRGRTHEGSGIGLALVHELVRLHGGTIAAASEVGRGTTFTIRIPLGAAHLPQGQVNRNSTTLVPPTATNAFVQEALHWLPLDEADDASSPLQDDRHLLKGKTDNAVHRRRILVADDNADMRRYLARLLADHFTVEAVSDGEQVLEAVQRHRPDLILCDVMMPRLDGFELLRELRADPATQSIPIILLSARAGEESRVEGLEAGADDYLVKPFSARELLARVTAQVQMAQLRQESKEQIRQSEERFRLFMNHSPTTAYIKDADGRYVFVNRIVEEQFGRPLEEWIGKTDHDFFSADEANLIRQNDLEVLASKTTTEFEESFARPEGMRNYLSFKFPLEDRDGRVLLAGMSVDITEQKRAEEAQHRLAAIVESSHDAILSIDLEGTITSWNRGAERLYGYMTEEILGKPISILIPHDHVDDFPVICQRLRKGERIEQWETVRVDRSGRRIDVSLSVSPVLDAAGRLIDASKIARDITAQKQAEVALRQSEERLAAELEATNRLHALSSRLLSAGDLTSGLEDVLENASETCGADLGSIQLLDPQMGSLEIVAQRGFHEDFLSHFKTALIDEGSACAQAMRTGQRINIEDVELAPEYEPHRPIAAAVGYRAVQSTPLKNHYGIVVGMLSTYFREPHRVSERDERQLDLYARHAADLIERLQYEQALRDSDRRKDEFLATLAHELRNPLAPLRNGLQVLKMTGPRDEMADEALVMMERQLGQMVHLIDDLLDLSRISRGKIKLRTERIELAMTVQQAVETSRPAIEQEGHDLTIELPAGPIFVDADITRLAQVFANLLNNASKYTERGGRIRLSVQRNGTTAIIAVRDNGVGIPPHMLPRVFDIFTQVDKNLERSQGGLGIGLSIVKRLVEMHGGSVEAHSEGQGMGSEFVVRLPIVPAVGPSHKHEAESKPPPSHRRILVVDDNRDAAVSLAMMLKMMGNEARTAHDGLEALEVAAAERPELILLDIGMPRMNGYDTARHIRQQVWAKGIVLVALTGWGQDEDRRKSQEAGFDAHITKPVEPETLEKLLATLHAKPK